MSIVHFVSWSNWNFMASGNTEQNVFNTVYEWGKWTVKLMIESESDLYRKGYKPHIDSQKQTCNLVCWYISFSSNLVRLKTSRMYQMWVDLPEDLNRCHVILRIVCAVISPFHAEICFRNSWCGMHCSVIRAWKYGSKLFIVKPRAT